jgi:hypothetical protein
MARLNVAPAGIPIRLSWETYPAHVKELFGRVINLAFRNRDTLQLQDEAC